MDEHRGRQSTSPGRGRRAGLVSGAVALGLAGLLVGTYAHKNVTGPDRAKAKVRAAGFVTRRATVDGHVLAYLEGPDNGPPLVLIHGQASRSTDHMLVLADLAADHHVFAVDVPGHGDSDRLDPASYTNVFVGDLLARFVDRVADQPVILSGHSSGGLLALRITAERPDLVAGLLLEDPPLFSSAPHRLAWTMGGTLPRVADTYLSRGEPGGDFQLHFLRHADYFALFGLLAGPIERSAIRWVEDHPGRPLQLWYLPPFVTVFFLGLVAYDPAFGAAWVRDGGRWYAGFDTDAALRSVDVPTTLVHTNYFEHRDQTAYQDGILMAAMDADDVARALSLLPADTRLVQLPSGHLVHFEKPAAYLDAVRELTARLG